MHTYHRKNHMQTLLTALLGFWMFIAAMPVTGISQEAVLTIGQVECDIGGGAYKEILDSTEEVRVCVALDPAGECEAILRELPSTGNFEQVAIRGESKVVCITAKRAMVVCKGEKAGGFCTYQIVSINSVPNPAFYITLIILLILIFIILLWRAFGPFFRRP